MNKQREKSSYSILTPEEEVKLTAGKNTIKKDTIAAGIGILGISASVVELAMTGDMSILGLALGYFGINSMIGGMLLAVVDGQKYKREEEKTFARAVKRESAKRSWTR